MAGAGLDKPPMIVGVTFARVQAASVLAGGVRAPGPAWIRRRPSGWAPGAGRSPRSPGARACARRRPRAPRYVMAMAATATPPTEVGAPEHTTGIDDYGAQGREE